MPIIYQPYIVCLSNYILHIISILIKLLLPVNDSLLSLNPSLILN